MARCSHRYLLLGAASVLLDTGTTCKPTSASAQWSASFDRFGPVEIGMTGPRVEEVLGAKLSESGPVPSQWTGESFGEPEPTEIDECHYVENQTALPGVSFMLLDGKIGRIDFTRGSYRTSKGAHIGRTEAEVKERYPGIQVAPNHYDEQSHDMTVSNKDHRFGILFETDDNVVTSFRVGLLEPIGYVEGCL